MAVVGLHEVLICVTQELVGVLLGTCLAPTDVKHKHAEHMDATQMQCVIAQWECGP